MTSSPRALARYLCFIVVGFFLGITNSSGTASNSVPVVTVSAASYERGAITLGGIASAFGSQLATATASATDIDPSRPGIQLPERLAGTTVQVNGVSAKLLFVSAGQVNFIVPDGLRVSVATIEITAGDGTVSSGALTVVETAPALFTANADGAGVPVGNLVRVRNGVRLPDEPLAQFDPVTKNYVAKPIALGPETDRVFLELYCTGVRGATDTNKDGNRQESVWVLVGGQTLTPTYAGPQADYAGLDQVNVEVPRTLKSAGKLHLSLHGQTSHPFGNELIYWGLTSRRIECEFGGEVPTGAVQIADFSPTTIVAGQQLTINGSGFALNPDDNRVTIGGLLAPVEMASATRLVVRVPFGAETARVQVKSPSGEGQSATPLTLHTTLSGYVEVPSDFSTTGYPLAQARVRVLGTSHVTYTNAEGVFQLPEVPLGELKVEVDATAILGPNVPPTRFVTQAIAGKDNLLTEPIWLPMVTGASVALTAEEQGGAVFSEVGFLSLAKKSRLQFSDGKTATQVSVSRLKVPPVYPAFRRVLPLHEATRIFRIAPLDATFTPAATLTVAIQGAAGGYQVFRYDQRPTSPTFGTLVPVEGVTGEAGQLRIPITETGDYVVHWDSYSAIYGNIVSVTGSLLLTDGKTPLQNAFVSAPFWMFGSQATDSLGSFTILSGVPSLQIRALRPNGVVLRTWADWEDSTNLNTLLHNPSLKVVVPVANSPEILGLPLQFWGRINERYELDILPVNNKQTVRSVAMSGARFATLLPLGNGVHRLRLQPGATDWGSYEIKVTATTAEGLSIDRMMTVQIVAPNAPPVIAAPPNQFVKPGETVSFDIVVTDPDTNQQADATIDPMPSFAYPDGLQIVRIPTANGVTLRAIWVPKPNQIGTYGLRVNASDNGYGKLGASKTMTINVVTVIPLNTWTLVSGTLQPGFGRVLRQLLVRDDAVYFGAPVFRSTDGGLTWSFLDFFGGIASGLNATPQHVFVSAFGAGVTRYELATGTSQQVNTGLRIGAQEGVGPVVISGNVSFVEVGNSARRRVYYSTDAGNQWALWQEGSGEQDLLVSDGQGSVFVRGSDKRISKAVWNGTLLTLAPTDLVPATLPHLISTVGNRMYAAVATANPAQDDILVSTDGGLHWQAAGFPVGKYRALHAVGTRIYTQTAQGAFVSLNEGQTWNSLALPPGAEVLSFASNRQYLYLSTTDGRLYLSPLP